jgi:flavin-dependent thymidylate synthase
VSQEIERWGDKAMFEAAPIAKQGDHVTPRVHLLWMTPDPLGAIAAMCRMYEGKPTYSLGDITDNERRHYWDQANATHLKAPLEAVKFHFFIEGVDRAFTHQMVRQRTAVYAQESMRFAVKDNLKDEASYPPSIAGLPKDDPARSFYEQTLDTIQKNYNSLISLGIPAEDARALLPHATTTRLNYVTDLRALADHAGNRLCTQAQFVWRLVFAEIVNVIRNYGSKLGEDMGSEFGAYRDQWTEYSWDWQFELMANSLIFRPVCFALNKCPFKASFDRACSIRNRVDAFAAAGIPSDRWEVEHDTVPGNPIVAGFGPQSVVRNESGEPVFIGAIKPVEWLADPAAARS